MAGFDRLRERAAWRPTCRADAETFAVANGRFYQAARLFGGAYRLRDQGGVTLSLPARDAYERAADRARANRGDAAFAAARGADETASPDELLATVDALLADIPGTLRRRSRICPPPGPD